MKKLIALFLVIALFASLGMTAFAAESAETHGGDAPADRALAATVLWVMAGQPVVNYAPGFEDLDPEGDYMHAVRWAASEGIIKGYDARTFGPDDPVTREQFSVMLYRYAQKHGLGFTGMWYFPLTAADAGDISDWADEAMHWVVMNAEAEVLSDMLLPKAVVTRKELGKMVTAYINGGGAETAAFHRVRLGTAPYTVLIPDIYVQGEMTEDMPYAADAVVLYYNDFTDTNVVIYQFSKEGLPEDIMGYAALEAEEDGAEVRSVEINGIPTAQFTSQISYNGTDYTTLVAVIDAGEDFVELALVSDGKSGNFEIHSVLNSLEKLAAPAEAGLAGLLRGTWMLADKDGKSALTNDKYVINFVSDAKAYVSASFLKGGGHWVNLKEADVAVSGNTMTLSSYPDEHTKVVDEFTITAINAGEFSADRKVAITANGTETLNVEAPVRFVKVDADYTDAILGSWEGRCTSAGSVFDDGKEHRWSYHADGSYVYYIKDGDNWVPSTNTLNEYFVAGNLLCTRWEDNGVENREWWEITIDGDAMTWTALRADENGQSFTAAFAMTKVAD